MLLPTLRWLSPTAVLRLPLHHSRAIICRPRVRLARASSPALSTHRTFFESNPNPSPRSNGVRRPKDDVEPPSFSLRALGLSRNMRIGVLTLVGIYGTIETWFYYQWALQWWRNRGVEDGDAVGRGGG
ncbi:hypothetical protein B0J12DRAFT_661305 [Macrophomina phaseolina]|uniref:Uncharacterized protein n=1 Tax=Macrophomina phaseolina TaxID=35725 RepID=A0ABQ8GG06_9PEZI|nr:hypothetical protein B0J12DRAFT_661305 [Macrophomina phaseolina]